MTTTQNIALDSCVVIDLMEKPAVGNRLRQHLRGKQVQIVLCDTVLSEVSRVRGYLEHVIVSRISKILGRQAIILATSSQERNDAMALSSNFLQCHNGDNLILAFCKMRDFTLVTFDRTLLRICDMAGVIAFSPFQAGVAI